MNKMVIDKREISPLSSIQPKPMKDDDIIPSPLILTSKNYLDFKVSSMENLLELNNMTNSDPHSDTEQHSKHGLDKINDEKLKYIREELSQIKKRPNRILSNQDTMRRNSSDDEEEVIHIQLRDGEGEKREDDDDEYYLLREESDELQYLNKQGSTILKTMKSYI